MEARGSSCPLPYTANASSVMRTAAGGGRVGLGTRGGCCNARAVPPVGGGGGGGGGGEEMLVVRLYHRNCAGRIIVCLFSLFCLYFCFYVFIIFLGRFVNARKNLSFFSNDPRACTGARFGRQEVPVIINKSTKLSIPWFQKPGSAQKNFLE